MITGEAGGAPFSILAGTYSPVIASPYHLHRLKRYSLHE
jgi:hypothetical protein